EHLHRMLEGIIDDPDTALRDLPLLDGPRRLQLLEDWNATAAEYPKDKLVDQIFGERVQEHPDAVAVASGRGQLTYKAIDDRSSTLAAELVSAGAEPGMAVGILLDRSLEIPAAFLAVLKAGAAYVSLDPSYPSDRLFFMIDDASIHIMISDRELPGFNGRTVVICSGDSDSGDKAGSPANLLPSGSTACVIYTSGSTGAPKGVCLPHHGVSRLVINAGYISLDSTDRMAQCSGSSFDAITFEVWGALLNGATLVIVEKEKLLSAPELASVIREQGVTTMLLTTALFNEIGRVMPSAFQPLKYLLFGGEEVNSARAKQVAREGTPWRLLNAYGPAEITTIATCYNMSAQEQEAAVPIGLPISNTVAHVLGPAFNLSPVGLVGELFVGGDGLASGYLNRPAATAERFVPNCFAAGPGERLYRSGDLVRRRPDGQIVFVGRNDDQVKVRGFRIELREVESAIRQYPEIADCAVVPFGAGSASDGNSAEKSNDKHLIAYVVAREGLSPKVDEVRRFLARRLPDYMIPSGMVLIDSIPLTPNGKIDRARLPQPKQLRPDLGAEYALPSTQMEGILSKMWASVLGVDRVGINDNFFDLGGHSLVATQLVSRIREGFKIDLPVRTLFENPTVADLAVAVEEKVLAKIENLSDQEAEQMLQGISF
ncbi:MAG TPA: non-ribosomal peptide synthetase, partial [Blastocatellia bacterium]